MTKEFIEQKVKESIKEVLSLPESEYKLSDNLCTDMGCDELDYVELMMCIERDLQKPIDDKDAFINGGESRFKTPQEIVDYLCDQYMELSQEPVTNGRLEDAADNFAKSISDDIDEQTNIVIGFNAGAKFAEQKGDESNFEDVQSELNKNFDNIRMGAEHTLFLNKLFEVKRKVK